MAGIDRGKRPGAAAKGERFGSVPGKLALELFDSINLPDTPCISPSLVFLFSLVRTPAASLSCSFIQQNAVPFKMKCREFINLYLSPKAFCTWTSILNYIILKLPIDKLLCV